MGIIDTATITLACPSCGFSESSRIRDKGNGWSGSSWDTPSFTKFDAKISGSPKTDFDVTGKCGSCGGQADVEHRYNT